MRGDQAATPTTSTSVWRRPSRRPPASSKRSRLLPPNTTFSAVVFDVFGSPGPSAAAWLKKTADPLAAQRYVATSVATGWLRLWFATAIGSMVAAAVATHLRLQALAAD